MCKLPSRDTLTTSRLLDGARAGDHSSVTRLYALWQPRFLRWGRKRGLSRDAAEDLAHEAFVRVLRGGWAGGPHGDAFMYTVIRRLWIDRARAAGTFAAARARYSETRPQHAAPKAEAKVCLEQVRASLSEAWAAKRLDAMGCSEREIAERLQVTRHNVRKLLAQSASKIEQMRAEAA